MSSISSAIGLEHERRRSVGGHAIKAPALVVDAQWRKAAANLAFAVDAPIQFAGSEEQP